MPLEKGSSQKTISRNIGELESSYKEKGKIGTSTPANAGKAHKQAVAIAMSEAGKGLHKEETDHNQDQEKQSEAGVKRHEGAKTKKHIKKELVGQKGHKHTTLKENTQLTNFISALAQKNYAAANKYLKTAIMEKVKNKIKIAQSIRPF